MGSKDSFQSVKESGAVGITVTRWQSAGKRDKPADLGPCRLLRIGRKDMYSWYPVQPEQVKEVCERAFKKVGIQYKIDVTESRFNFSGLPQNHIMVWVPTEIKGERWQELADAFAEEHEALLEK